jgi:NAD(P)-dependent dehydrogenase (short-subunit alcohol dehydrogenase family)
MDLQLDGKHALITGGSKGIGLACARGLLEEGARVSLVSRDMKNLTSARRMLLAEIDGAGDRIAIYSADLKDAGEAARMVSEAEAASGPIDILVNSAGAARRTPPDDLTPADWQAAMQAKYFTYIHVMDPVIKRMAVRGQGAIVNVIGSGGKTASPTHLPGGAANAALMLASAGLANAYASRNVRVNAVNPGITRTERMQQGLEADAKLAGISVDEALLRANAALPLGRIATPQEIANAVVFLCSPRASYITGAILAMDGAAKPMVV